jgi:O-6-methylguanine DNA methyltransferase
VRFTSHYSSPAGDVLLASDGESLTGLWFEGQRYYAAGLSADAREENGLGLFAETKAWLDAYFAGRRPSAAELPLAFGASEYRRVVWKLLTEIPFGQVRTYGEIALLAAERTGGRASARAAGGAAAHNPISIIVPCHRVIGAKGELTGYAGGTERKLMLLRLEGARLPGKISNVLR